MELITTQAPPLSRKFDSVEDRRERSTVTMEPRVGVHEARRVGDMMGIDWNACDVRQFRLGLDIERARGSLDPARGSSPEEAMAAGGIVLAHLTNQPDYYTQLAVTICSPMRSFHTFRQLLL